MKTFGFLLAAGLAIAACPAVRADELILHTVSYHSTKPGDDPNNYNPGIGYSLDNGWAAGIYYNSYRRPSAYVAKDFNVAGPLGVFAGGATGYDSVSGRPITLIGGLRLTMPVSDTANVNLLVAPGIGKLQTVAHLTLTIKLR